MADQSVPPKKLRKMLHGAGRPGHETREFRAWTAAKDRCRKLTGIAWTYYGSRGIGMAPEWQHDFKTFLEAVGPCPPGMWLERISNERGYVPGNVRWATPTEQGRNKRNNRLLTLGEETHCMSEWAEATGLPWGTLAARLRRGWTVEETLTLPLHAKAIRP